MENEYYPIFTVTREGVVVDGLPLTKSLRSVLPEETLRQVERIEDLLKQVKPEEWDNPQLFRGAEYSPLVRASMMAALLSPQPWPLPVRKYNPYHLGPGPGGGQFTTADMDGQSLSSGAVGSGVKPPTHPSSESAGVVPLSSEISLPDLGLPPSLLHDDNSAGVQVAANGSLSGLGAGKPKVPNYVIRTERHNIINSEEFNALPSNIKNNLKYFLDYMNNSRPEKYKIKIGSVITFINEKGEYEQLPNQQCATWPRKFAPYLGPVTQWKPDILVKGNKNIPVGMFIATFQYLWGNDMHTLHYGPENAKTGRHNMSHVGVYIGQDDGGLYMLNQYVGSGGLRLTYVPWRFSGNDQNNHIIPVSHESGIYYYTILGGKSLVPLPKAGSDAVSSSNNGLPLDLRGSNIILPPDESGSLRGNDWPPRLRGSTFPGENEQWIDPSPEWSLRGDE